MDIGEAVYLGQNAMLTIGMICGPVLLAALVVGIIISLLQGCNTGAGDDGSFRPKDHCCILGDGDIRLMDA